MFLEIVDDVVTIEESQSKNKKRRDATIQKFNAMEHKNSATVGFFNKKPKADKLSSYRAKINECDELDVFFNAILNVLAQVVINTQMDVIRLRKKVSYDDVLKTLLNENKKFGRLFTVLAIGS